MLCSTAFRFSNLIIDFSVPAFGRAGADLTRPIDSPYFFLMAGTQYRAGRPSERRNTTESETVTGSNAQRPSLLYPGNGHTYFLLSIMAAGKVSEFIFSLPVRQSLGHDLFSCTAAGVGVFAISPSSGFTSFDVALWKTGGCTAYGTAVRPPECRNTR